MILLSDLREGQTCSILDFLDILCSPIIRLTPRICLVLELIYLSERTFPYASNFTAEHVVIAHHDGSHPRVLPGELQGRGSLESPRDGGAWRAPGTGEPGALPSAGPHRVGRDWGDLGEGEHQQVWLLSTMLLFKGSFPTWALVIIRCSHFLRQPMQIWIVSNGEIARAYFRSKSLAMCEWYMPIFKQSSKYLQVSGRVLAS